MRVVQGESQLVRFYYFITLLFALSTHTGTNALISTSLTTGSALRTTSECFAAAKKKVTAAGDSVASTERMEVKGGTQHSSYVDKRDVKGLQDGMKMRQLPNTNIVVSELCLGTMMYGEQISKKSALSQLDVATGEYGINFLDTAESFPAPSGPSTAGHSETIIGEWLKGKGKSNRRENTIISTKICGFSDQITWCRKDQTVGTRVNKDQVIEAVDAQLKRLGTDYIDLLQIHWPDRYVPMFGANEYQYELERVATPVKEQLEVMHELIQKGKIRAFGLSNETPYGVASFTTSADLLGLSRPVTTQNCYSLLVRNEFENGMIEACSIANGNLGMLAYSPLAGGALTGKYDSGVRNASPEARLRKYVGYMHRYLSSASVAAVKEYIKAAKSLSLPLTPVALSYVYTRPFVTSTIIGATSNEQLEENVMALNLPISPEMDALIQEVNRKYLDPTRGVFEVVDPNKDYIDPSKLPWGAKDQDVDPDLDALISKRLAKF